MDLLSRIFVIPFFLGHSVTDEELDEVNEVSASDGKAYDFLDEGFRLKCENLLPNPLEIERDCREAFIYLKFCCVICLDLKNEY